MFGDIAIFLGQGNYVVVILKGIQMEDYKPTATPMIINLKATTSYSNLVDPMLYRKLSVEDCSSNKNFCTGLVSNMSKAIRVKSIL